MTLMLAIVTVPSMESLLEPERKAFGTRLKLALADAGLPDCGAALLAREFNRHSPQNVITLHAARKWLLGETLPTQDNLRVLSTWLSVSPAWLRFGEAEISTRLAVESPSEILDYQLARDIARLPISQQVVVRELVRTLLRQQVLSGQQAPKATEP